VHETSSMQEVTQQVVHILDTKYEKADLQSVVSDNCMHLRLDDQNKSLELLIEYDELCDGTLGDWKTETISFELKEGTKPYHGRPFPVPRVLKETITKELNRLCDLGVLEFQPTSEWTSPYITPKKDKTECFITDLGEAVSNT